MDEDLRGRLQRPDPARQSRPMFPINPRPHQPTHHQPQPEPVPAASHKAKATPVQKKPAAKRQTRPKRKWILKSIVILLILGLVSAAGGYYYMVYIKPPTALPKNLVNSVDYPVYYPKTLPSTYKYQLGSAHNQSGLFIYNIANGTKGVVVSQQKKPTTNFNPSGLPGFKSVSVSDGTAVIGMSGDVLTVIYVTPTTLINMTAVNNISRDDMITITQNLKAVKKPANLF